MRSGGTVYALAQTDDPAQREEHDFIAFAWFVFEHGHSGPPSLGFLDWKDAA